jgi:hypothetical protein
MSVLILCAGMVLFKSLLTSSDSTVALALFVIGAGVFLSPLLHFVIGGSEKDALSPHTTNASWLATLPIFAIGALILANDYAQTLRVGRSEPMIASFADWRLSVGVLFILFGSLTLHLLATARPIIDQTVVWTLVGTSLLADMAAISLMSFFMGEQFALGTLTVQNRLGSTIVSFFLVLTAGLSALTLLRLGAILLAERRQLRSVQRVATIASPIHHGIALTWLIGYLYFVVVTTSV